MGSFDSIIVRCPECGADVEFQTKAGRCVMAVHSPEEVPTEIACDFRDGRTERCGSCGYSVTLREPDPNTVRMIVE